MKLIRGLIVALLLCAVLISPACAFQVYEPEEYTPTSNINIGTEITSKMTLVYEPSDAMLSSGLVLTTDLKNAKWDISIGHSNHVLSTRITEGNCIKINSFDYYYSTKIVEVYITVVGNIDREESIFIKIEEYRDGNKLRKSYESEPFYVSTQSHSPLPPTPVVQKDPPEELYALLSPYQAQITELSQFGDTTKFQKTYDTIKSNIDNYASTNPTYTSGEIKSQIEGLKTDLISIQRQLLEENLNTIRTIISSDSQYLGVYNELVEQYKVNDYSNNPITKSVELYKAVVQENENKNNTTTSIVFLVIFAVVGLAILLLIIRNKNRKETEF